MNSEDRSILSRIEGKLDDFGSRILTIEMQVAGNGSGVGILDRIKKLEHHNEMEREERIKRQKELDERREVAAKERQADKRAARAAVAKGIFAGISATGTIFGILAAVGVL